MTGGAPPSAVANEQRVDADLALLQVPVRPHRLVARDVARRRVHVDRVGQPEHAPELPRPRAWRDDDLLSHLDAAGRGLDGGDRAVRALVEARDLDAADDRDARLAALAVQALDGVHVEGEPALVLVQAHGHALRAPVREEPLHVLVDLGLADDQLGAVPDPLLALERGGEIRLLDGRAERDVADGVVGVRLGIRLPHLDAGLHQLAHRGLEVVVADDAACDSGRAGTGVRLVEDEHVPARAEPPRGQLLREVVGGRQAVDPGSYDDVLRPAGQIHVIASSGTLLRCGAHGL